MILSWCGRKKDKKFVTFEYRPQNRVLQERWTFSRGKRKREEGWVKRERQKKNIEFKIKFK